MCTVGLYVSLCLMIFLCPFLHCKALRTAMYKRYINSIIIIKFSCKKTLVHMEKTAIDFLVKKPLLIWPARLTANFFWPIGNRINRVPL